MRILTWDKIKPIIDAKGLSPQYIDLGDRYVIHVVDGSFILECEIYKSVETAHANDFETNYISKANKHTATRSEPFAAKTIGNYKIYQRVHGFSVTFDGVTSTGTATLSIPYTTCKITGVEVINPHEGDSCDFNVHDTPTGTISGTPDLKLNQFGFSVYLPEAKYHRDSNYDADLIQNMTIKIVYTQAVAAARTVYFNAILHELTP